MQGYLAYLFVPLQRQDNMSMYDQVVRHSLHSRSVVMVVVPSFFLICFFSLIYFKNYLNPYNGRAHLLVGRYKLWQWRHKIEHRKKWKNQMPLCPTGPVQPVVMPSACLFIKSCINGFRL
jgi:hypothetical protein